MPHSGPPLGFQALILCGPGVSLNTFTSIPEEFPKALVPIANRPMVWYPLDWCYRMGITNITLITPKASRSALEASLSQNPHLTSLPSPSPTVIAPEGLTLTTGTAELLRLAEIQSCIKSDFIVLPCDLVCDIPGVTFLEAWMTSHGSLDASWGGERLDSGASSLIGMGGERCGRRGGISVWYPTAPDGAKTKTEVADFLAVTPLEKDDAPTTHAGSSHPSSLTKLVYTMPMDSLKDAIEEHGALLIRHSLLKRHGKIKMLTTYRDSHIYILPYWVKEMAMMNEKFESISEDLIGWWAKAEWQNGLGEKLGLREIFDSDREHGNKYSSKRDQIEEDIDLMAMSTTKSARWLEINSNGTMSKSRPGALTRSDTIQEIEIPPQPEKLVVPPILAYIHSSRPSEPLVRRVDNSALLLATSLRLAKLEAISEAGDSASPFAHQNKLAYPAGIAQRCTVSKADCLLAENVTVEEKAVIKESVVGANCHIASGVRLTRCLLMDGVVIGERSQLTDCIIGRRAKVGRECVLKECEVQNGNVVPDDTDAKNGQFMIFEGLDDDMVGVGDDLESEDMDMNGD
ncbi:Translation initiation factor eIF-2B subunit gamma [Ophidiomyces ophidiicola]|uniref:Translation initiation factor eIF-2B subunit gamma n=1 Tax=Ophidiomyces ophidiicola TaxID=1387563 RepID=A0ACB8URD0_9EURO|nr:Translation initiation factor eIF-2B subunit gamma [Ophidiomyces ophidiicola]KAI1916455.1 Translation initiation factor eIF-2B subunit gamma [Ophidiomyces ophidiicola]KAI1928815.1 Translation initiation factor eIF-2B subunit gamma [Ophidiomyces ophidiicola]KAI1942825.1 Translation initiation factor eIF-2B subunit gamma [Ophidiomyces ophidiicola]KAI1960143.1 Translation initiation factor eIF-2B subunit gamma [Ophidiomyces ophidiicola]